MKSLFFLYILLGLWIVSLGNKYEHIGPFPIGESDGVVLLTLLGDELPLTLLGCMIDYTDVEVVNLASFNEPHTNIGDLVRPDDTHLAVDTSCDTTGNVSPIVSDNGDGLVLKMEHRSVLGEAIYRRQYNDQYEKHPFHAAKIAKN